MCLKYGFMDGNILAKRLVKRNINEGNGNT